ncbi:MAG: acetyl-CoA carboxylase biotin carboxyl carrier protein subunit [Candidatus Zixiibacteriota bacterium]|nr:MAG: acetyl-CoA carboxylase biotin carboxyl carrier protein subunit [candidate division Zixibacteria bacterium]
MDFEYSYDGKTFLVKIDGDSSGGYKAVIADKEYEFTASNISLNEFSILLNRKNMKAYVAESDDGVFVHIEGRVIKFKKPGAGNGGFGGAGGEFGVKDEISTPMPGKVVKIIVSEGDRVEAGQSLVIVESMKMENEIKSPTAGEVVSVNFKNGDLVEPGQTIIKLNPSDAD